MSIVIRIQFSAPIQAFFHCSATIHCSELVSLAADTDNSDGG